MRFHGLDLNLLVALDALLEERTVTKAGHRLNLTQSAMSDALGRLRDYFADELLIRVGPKLVLTPLAEELAHAVREALIQIEGTVMDRSRFASARFDPATCQRTFKLLTSDFSLAVVIPPLLQRVQREAPDVKFEFNLLRDQPTQILDRAETDLLIIADDLALPDHPREALFEDSFTCVIWEGNRKIGRTLSRKAYLEAGHVTMHVDRADGKSSPSLKVWFLQQTGVKFRIDIATTSMAALPGLVVGTDRITTVHTRLARWAQSRFPVRLLPPPIPTPTFVMSMQWHRSKSNDPALSWLRRVLKEVVSTIP